MTTDIDTAMAAIFPSPAYLDQAAFERYIDLSFTRVTDLTPLCQALPSSACATRVTDLAALAEMPVLRRVVVQRLEVDEAAIERLRKARPEVEVVG